MTTLFWISLGTLVYIYVGYPLLVWALARLFGRKPYRAAGIPMVSLLIPARDEAAHIEQKLRNSLALDYPRARLEIVVASDGSTDQTTAVVRRFAREGVRLIEVREHIGKSLLLTRAVPHLRGEIVVFSDASSALEPDALRQMVRCFADSSVGCVCGLYRLKGAGDVRGQGEGLYWRYETFLKRQESRLHSILGAHGAFYAIRTALFEPLGACAINDDYLIPMRIVARGLRAVYEPQAVAWEQEAASLSGEFGRRRRIAMGNCQQIVILARLLNPLRGWVAFCFFSHKVLRTLAPLFLLSLLIASAGLAFPWNTVAVIPQVLFYASAFIGYRCQRRGRLIRWLAPPLYFCVGNLAMLAGLLKYCFHSRGLVWERAK